MSPDYCQHHCNGHCSGRWILHSLKCGQHTQWSSLMLRENFHIAIRKSSGVLTGKSMMLSMVRRWHLSKSTLSTVKRSMIADAELPRHRPKEHWLAISMESYSWALIDNAERGLSHLDSLEKTSEPLATPVQVSEHAGASWAFSGLCCATLIPRAVTDPHAVPELLVLFVLWLCRLLIANRSSHVFHFAAWDARTAAAAPVSLSEGALQHVAGPVMADMEATRKAYCLYLHNLFYACIRVGA